MLFETDNKYKSQLTETDLQAAYTKYRKQKAEEFYNQIIDNKKIDSVVIDNKELEKVIAAAIDEILKDLQKSI